MTEKKIAIRLIFQLKSGELNDQEISQVVEELDRILPDPNYWDYTIDHTPDLTAEEIVEKAFNYKPIQL